MKNKSNHVTPLHPHKLEKAFVNIRMPAFGGIDVEYKNTHPVLVGWLATMAVAVQTIERFRIPMKASRKDE